MCDFDRVISYYLDKLFPYLIIMHGHSETTIVDVKLFGRGINRLRNMAYSTPLHSCWFEQTRGSSFRHCCNFWCVGIVTGTECFMKLWFDTSLLALCVFQATGPWSKRRTSVPKISTSSAKLYQLYCSFPCGFISTTTCWWSKLPEYCSPCYLHFWHSCVTKVILWFTRTPRILRARVNENLISKWPWSMILIPRAQEPGLVRTHLRILRVHRRHHRSLGQQACTHALFWWGSPGAWQ